MQQIGMYFIYLNLVFFFFAITHLEMIHFFQNVSIIQINISIISTFSKMLFLLGCNITSYIQNVSDHCTEYQKIKFNVTFQHNNNIYIIHVYVYIHTCKLSQKYDGQNTF